MIEINEIDLALANSLKELSRKKPIEKITIREITDGAGVIRPTFYNHFQDKYALLEWIVQTDLIAPLDEHLTHMEIAAGAAELMEKMLHDKAFYNACIRLEGQNSFVEILRTALRNLVLKHVDEEAIKKRVWYDWLTPKRVAEYFAESVSYALIEWIRDGMKIPIDEIIECFAYLFTHTVLEMALGVTGDD